MGVVDEVFITFPESDVVTIPLKLFCKLLVHTVNIDERLLLHLPDVVFLHPMLLPDEMRFAEDHSDLE